MRPSIASLFEAAGFEPTSLLHIVVDLTARKGHLAADETPPASRSPHPQPRYVHRLQLSAPTAHGTTTIRTMRSNACQGATWSALGPSIPERMNAPWTVPNAGKARAGTTSTFERLIERRPVNVLSRKAAAPKIVSIMTQSAPSVLTSKVAATVNSTVTKSDRTVITRAKTSEGASLLSSRGFTKVVMSYVYGGARKGPSGAGHRCAGQTLPIRHLNCSDQATGRRSRRYRLLSR